MFLKYGSIKVEASTALFLKVELIVCFPVRERPHRKSPAMRPGQKKHFKFNRLHSCFGLSSLLCFVKL